MLSLTRERTTGSIVISSAGVVDDAALHALVEAIALVPDEVPVIVDLSGARRLAEHAIRRLAHALAQRLGPVSFRGTATWPAPAELR